MEKKTGTGGSFPIPSPTGWSVVKNETVVSNEVTRTEGEIIWDGRAGDLVFIHSLISQGDAKYGYYVPAAFNVAAEAFYSTDALYADVPSDAACVIQGADGTCHCNALGYNGDYVRLQVLRPSLQDANLPRMSRVKRVIGEMIYDPPLPYTCDLVAILHNGDLVVSVQAGDLVIILVQHSAPTPSGVSLTLLADAADGLVGDTLILQQVYVADETGTLTLAGVTGVPLPGAMVLRPVSLERI